MWVEKYLEEFTDKLHVPLLKIPGTQTVAAISNLIVSRWQEKSICLLENDYPTSVIHSFITLVKLQEQNIFQPQYFSVQIHANLNHHSTTSWQQWGLQLWQQAKLLSALWMKFLMLFKGLGLYLQNTLWARSSKTPQKIPRWRLLSIRSFSTLNCPVTKIELVCVGCRAFLRADPKR